LCWLILVAFDQAALAAETQSDTEKAGDILMVLIPAVGLGSTLFYEDGHDGTVQFLKAFATSEITTEVLKITTHKERPNGACCKSFPSGHTSAAFMGAAFIHKRYGLSYAVPAYIGASFVGYSRVYADKHYGIDVVAGAAIGVLSSFYFTQPYEGVTVTPLAGPGTFGASVTVMW
jgi:membrane-associated phospholipid phosphatase